jgi:hypothetical protein
MYSDEIELKFNYPLECRMCGGEVKKISITIYDEMNLKNLILYRCQECMRLFSKLDDVDILI